MKLKDKLKNPKSRESFFLDMYRQSFPSVAGYVKKNGGTLEDAKDIFQDSLVIFYEKAVSPGFVLKKSEKAYLFGIAKHLWFNRRHEISHFQELEDHEDLISQDEANHGLGNKIVELLEASGKKCMEMLKAFYYDHLSMEELSASFGYATTRSATVQKYKCLEKVRDKVKEKTLHYEDFIA
ncbi:RNA polymerase sigma factor [Negadavirga shengliensis]|uniref:RNA polymerase sigma factor n=1 Tax=Negadavirga shengliensis TaxID=1389218 RepID=A0ABV9T942_9BACT